MAQYKVPQDVEADDKLLGPFTFRQFIYLMVMGGCIALAIALFRIFPLLAIIPAPFAIFFAVLALPLKKDQPMETYLAAIISYHLKPKKRLWFPGQRESTIVITAPKKIEEPRTRDLTSEEASHRLSFLANVVDTEGYAIRDNTTTPIRDDILADTVNTPDMFDTYSSPALNNMIKKEDDARRTAIINQMRAGLTQQQTPANPATTQPQTPQPQPIPQPTAASQPAPNPLTTPLSSPVVIKPESPENLAKLKNLSKNPDLSVSTIAKEAKRINKKEDDDEVFISLH